MNLPKKIKKIKNSVVAIGFRPAHDQIAIVGSGFFVGNKGRILTVAHLIHQLPENHRNDLMAMVVSKQEPNGLEHYTWIKISLVKEDKNNDVAIFQAVDLEKALFFKSPKLELGDSDKIEVGEGAYFIGFPYAGQLMHDGFGVTRIVNKTIVSNIKQNGIDSAHPRNFIIVDAISNPGNSGCPLIDIETNKVIGIMSIAFRIKSRTNPDLDIREPMHIGAARPINLAKEILSS